MIPKLPPGVTLDQVRRYLDNRTKEFGSLGAFVFRNKKRRSPEREDSVCLVGWGSRSEAGLAVELARGLIDFRFGGIDRGIRLVAELVFHLLNGFIDFRRSAFLGVSIQGLE